jgi:hypothetical protein
MTYSETGDWVAETVRNKPEALLLLACHTKRFSLCIGCKTARFRVRKLVCGGRNGLCRRCQKEPVGTVAAS